MLRWTMKRQARHGIDVARVRATLGPRPGVVAVPKGWRVTPGVADGVAFERAERVEGPAMRGDLAVLYLHGGGYFFGSPRTHRQLILAMARVADAPAVALDYRLAPEHPCPAALEDALAGYRWLRRTEPGRRIVVAGDSAGGGLALALACAVRDAGLEPPVGVVAFSPWTDMAMTGASIAANAESCAMFTPGALREAIGLVLGGVSPTDQRISPLYADLAGLPPLLVFAGADELLRDDGVMLAEKARAAGGRVETHVVAGVPHVWPLFARVLPEGRESLEQVRAFLARLT
jgi:acetyl esterase/lipase